MSDRYCSLIVLAPGAPSTFKINLSRSTITTLIIAFLFSLLAGIWGAHALPTDIDDFDRASLAAENQSLKAEASHASIHLQKLSEKVLELEVKSQKINELIAQ
jgi:hypothetical protein